MSLNSSLFAKWLLSSMLVPFSKTDDLPIGVACWDRKRVGMKVELVKFRNRRVIFLPGFPGIRSRQNRDIAETVARQTGRDADVLIYPGLGVAPGTFGFQNCLTWVRDYVSELTARPECRDLQIDLVGHSWGGYLALRIADEFAERVHRLVLMSPLLEFPGLDSAIEGLHQYQKDNPSISLGDLRQSATELAAFSGDVSAFDLIRRVPERVPVLFLQAEGDAITPVATALEAVKLFKRRPIFELTVTDHSFVINRTEISDRIARFLR